MAILTSDWSRDFLGELDYWGLSALHLGNTSCYFLSLLPPPPRKNIILVYIIGKYFDYNLEFWII